MAVMVAQYCELLNATELFAWKWSEWSISCHACFTTMKGRAAIILRRSPQASPAYQRDSPGRGGEARDKELIGEMGPRGPQSWLEALVREEVPSPGSQKERGCRG